MLKFERQAILGAREGAKEYTESMQRRQEVGKEEERSKEERSKEG